MTTNYSLYEVTANKAVAGDSFGQGTMDFVFTIGSPNCVNMSRSYFKLDMTLANLAGEQPSETDLVAFADNAPGNLFSNCYFRMGQQDASTITSFLPQASMLKKRLGKSHAWLNTVGKSAYMDSASFATRCTATSSRTLQLNTVTDEQEFYKGATNPAATITIAATGVVTGNVTAFDTAGYNRVQPGDILAVRVGPGAEGLQYHTVVNIPDNFSLQLEATAGMVPVAAPTAAFHFIRRNVANTGLGKNVISVLWQPPIGIFDHTGWLGAGDYRLSLTPDANYKLTGLESPVTIIGDNWKVTVNDIRFYAYQGKASIPAGVHNLGLTEMALASKALGNGSSTNNLQFSVPPSTMYLTVFTQSNATGSNPFYPPSKFKARSSVDGKAGDTTLTSIQVTYASISKPSTRWTSEFKSAGDSSIAAGLNVQKMTQRYNDSFLENNNSLDGAGGVETFGEWIQRGPFYHFIFSRDLTDRATEVQVNLTFSDISDAQAYLCAWYHNTIQFNVSEGMITQLVSRQI